MQIVIDIPEEVYKSIQDNDYCGISNGDMYNAIKNGTPLPKGHGDLIDRTEVIKSLFDYHNGKKTIGQCIDDVPTTIEADKQNVGMCQQNVGEMSEKQTDGDLISRHVVLDRWDELSVRGRTEFDQAVMMLPSAEKTAEWIPCSERLPEEYRPVMATVKDRTVNGYEYNVYPEVRYSEKEGWEWAYEAGADYWTNLGIGKVIAWSYYPEPYKEKGESEEEE